MEKDTEGTIIVKATDKITSGKEVDLSLQYFHRTLKYLVERAIILKWENFSLKLDWLGGFVFRIQKIEEIPDEIYLRVMYRILGGSRVPVDKKDAGKIMELLSQTRILTGRSLEINCVAASNGMWIISIKE